VPNALLTLSLKPADMAATHAGPPLANGLQPLSCLRCAHRKVRCDRLAPCANCTKHDVLCEFPQPKTEKRQRRRVAASKSLSSSLSSSSSSSSSSSWNKVRARLDRYEEMLKDLGVDVESISDSPRRTVADSPMRDNIPRQETTDSAAAGGRLIVSGKRSRYIEGNLSSRIGEDVRYALEASVSKHGAKD
jgi:Fungal Zn(2)-Cys(6) binuclear cluster domain